MPPLENSDSDRLLERIIVSIREEPVPDFRDSEAHGHPGPNTLGMSNSTARGSSARPSGFPRYVLTAVAVAAAFAVLLFGVFTYSRPLSGSSLAFAEVKTAVSKAQTMRCRYLDFHGDRDPVITSVASASGVGSRSEGPGGVETITNWKSERMVYIDHRNRTAEIMQLYLDSGSRSDNDRFMELIRSLPSSGAKNLGSEQIDGKRVVKYALQHHGEYVVYVDASSRLPIRLELAIEKETAGVAKFREVVTDLVFDAPIDESLFEIKVPEGYQVSKCEQPKDRQAVDTRSIVVSPTTGFAGLQLGAAKDQVTATMGQPDEIREEGRQGASAAPGANAPVSARVTYHLRYPSLGFDITATSDEGINEIRCYGRSELGNAARDFLGKTDKQLGLGATIDAVLQAYGKPEVRVRARDELWLYPHQGWTFRFLDGKLSSFTTAKPVAEDVIITDHGDGSWETTVKSR